MKGGVGVFGGTFDPIHHGHLRSAEEIAEELDLGRVLFVPSAEPPHKRRRDVAGAAHRLAMVRLAVRGNPRFRASDLEVRRGGRSYSVDTLRHLRRRLGPQAGLWFFVGLDAFREIESWRDYADIFALADVVVTSRPPAAGRPGEEELPVAVRDQFCYRRGRGWIHRSGHTILFRSVTPLAISATDIRARLALGRSVRYLVPTAVQRYIDRHRLYRKRG